MPSGFTPDGIWVSDLNVRKVDSDPGSTVAIRNTTAGLSRVKSELDTLIDQGLEATSVRTSSASPITALVGELVRLNANGAITVNAPAPASLAEGEVFGIQVVTGDPGANNITVARNGHSTINEVAASLVLDTKGTFIFRRAGTDLVVESSAPLMLAVDDAGAADGYVLSRVAGAPAWVSPTGGGTVDVSGTPNAAEYPRWTDANTLEARTTTQVRTDLGLVIGTNVQAQDADLDALAGQSGTGLYARTGAGTGATRTLTAGSAKISIGNGSGASANPTVDLGAVASTDLSDSASLYKSGGTDVAVADGGTGSSSASGARTNLGLVIGTDVLAVAGTGLVDGIQGHIEVAANKTYVLDLKAPHGYTVNSLAAKTASGTCTAKLTIDGVDVTGISALSVSSTEASATASAANTVGVDTTLALVVSANSAALDLTFTVKITR